MGDALGPGEANRMQSETVSLKSYPVVRLPCSLWATSSPSEQGGFRLGHQWAAGASSSRWGGQRATPVSWR